MTTDRFSFPAKPSRFVGLAVSAALVILWLVLRLWVFERYSLPIAYTIPLLICVWTCNRRALWGMSAVFAAAHTVKQLWVLPAGALPGWESWTTFGTTFFNIGVGAIVVHLIIDARDRLEQSLSEIQAANRQIRGQAAAVREEKDRLSALMNSIQDEIWFTDTDKKVALANPSALPEFGFEAAGDIHGEKLASSLEVYRPDRTPRPADEAPPLRALNGEVVKNEEEIIRTPATGELRYRQVSAAPVRDGNGHIIGSVSVVRDVTDQKRAEEALQKSEERWATTLSSIGDGVIATDNAGRIAFVNAIAEELTGWTLGEAAGKPVTEVFQIINEQSRNTVEDPVAKVLREGMIVGLANHTVLIRKDGTEVPIDDSGAPIRDRDGNIIGVVLVFRDITERRRAEERAKHLASFPESNPSPVIEVDSSGKITFCNPGTLDALKGVGMSNEGCDIFLPGDLQGILENWDKKNVSTLHREVPVRDRVFEETIHLLPQFEVARIYAVDITERKLRETRVARVTRLYAMLSRVNEAIVRADDQGSLYGEVCRIIAELGEFPLVWVGEVKEGRVVPVASCGPAADYLKEVRIEIEGDLGKGPTGTCVREDRPVVNDDFDTNAATLPWREAALRYGFRASAAFPLRVRRKVVGAITLYAAQPADFDPERIDLLEALSADVSYALDTLEQERMRAQAEVDLQLSLSRFELLAHTAGDLLQSRNPQRLVNTLCREVMEHLDCQVFFNFLTDDASGRLRLNGYAGIPEEEAGKIEWLDYGVAVCGWVAREAPRMVAERIPTTPDPRTDLVKSYGIKAYACHPLLGPDGLVLGTLSFGTRGRETFSDEDLSLMKAVADQVAVAMIRMKDEEAVKTARDELEGRVKDRTAELQSAYNQLMRETEEREQLQAQLRQVQKLEALGTLSGGIAHDFNNILAAIIGFTEIIAGHSRKGSREERHLKRVMEAALRGRELVRQMLTFSRKTEQEKKPLRLSDIVKETARLLRATTPTTISIRVNVKSESGVILGDPVQIQQVLMNLCTNAAYAMREKGGNLDIQLADFAVSPSGANAAGMTPGLYMKVVVRDTGTGISPGIIDKIFDPFFTTKKLGEGTGLGLSVVHGIVRQSNGHITAESEPGLGSTFSVYFPKVTEVPTADAVGDDVLPRGNERILFIDDEEALVEMGEDILAELGYEVTSRTSSREALSLIKEDPRRFDLVITDQTMPDITGIELAREILALRADMPIIMCTGFSQLVDAPEAKAAGIKAFAMKPMTKREIARTIRQVIDG